MLLETVKRLVSRLPESWQMELKRLHYRRAIRKDRFSPDEPEDALLDALISPGDWVVDVGANIGHYARRFSDLVGSSGRVFALEPVPHTFSLLSANSLSFKNSNMTLLNVAASDEFGEVGFSVPILSTGLKNYYMAAVDAEGKDSRVMAFPLDALEFNYPVRLVNVDVEGHEMRVLRGMVKLIERYRPTLIVETHSEEVSAFLEDLGYSVRRLVGSPNVLAEAHSSPVAA